MNSINKTMIIMTLIVMGGTALYHSIDTYNAAAGYRQCLSNQPGARKGSSRLVFTDHQEWLRADNACKPY